MAAKHPTPVYYYAGGKRVALEPADDLVAVDTARLAAKAPGLTAEDPALRGGTPLRGGLRLLSRDSLQPGTADLLRGAGVTQPVFRHAGTVMVALPELRVEDSEAKLAQVRAYTVGKAETVGEADGRLTLEPVSADGRDALTLANELVENCGAASVSPRFIRVVPGPGVRG